MELYQGVWPQIVSRLAKYAVRFLDGAWKITVLYDAGEGLRYLAVDGAETDLVNKINEVKTALRDQPGGAFYINEYRHVLVPVTDTTGNGPGSHYYYACRLNHDLSFDFEGRALTTLPVGGDGTPLNPGASWVGPRPGIPYVLAAGGGDIYYESPALTETAPVTVRPGVTRKVQLSKILGSRAAVARVTQPVGAIRGHQGGRFYVNEHGAIFTPVDSGDGNGLDYIYCGDIDRSAWFPEPSVEG